MHRKDFSLIFVIFFIFVLQVKIDTFLREVSKGRKRDACKKIVPAFKKLKAHYKSLVINGFQAEIMSLFGPHFIEKVTFIITVFELFSKGQRKSVRIGTHLICYDKSSQLSVQSNHGKVSLKRT